MKKYIIIAVVALLVGGLVGYMSHSSGGTVKGIAVGQTSNFSNVSTNSLQVGVNCDFSYLPCPNYQGFTVSSIGAVVSSTTIQRGGILATTTGSAASTTIQSSDLASSTIQFNINLLAGFTLTLPATTTITSLIPTAGDTLEFTILNSTTTANTYITVLAGTGSLLQSTASTTRIYPLMGANLRAVRKSNTDILWILTGN